MENNQWFLSSTGNSDLSLTIKGLLLSVIPLFVAVAQMRGVIIEQNTIDTFVSAIVTIVQGVTAIVSSVMILRGFFRKIVNWMKPAQTPVQ